MSTLASASADEYRFSGFLTHGIKGILTQMCKPMVVGNRMDSGFWSGGPSGILTPGASDTRKRSLQLRLGFTEISASVDVDAATQRSVKTYGKFAI